MKMLMNAYNEAPLREKWMVAAANIFLLTVEQEDALGVSSELFIEMYQLASAHPTEIILGEAYEALEAGRRENERVLPPLGQGLHELAATVPLIRRQDRSGNRPRAYGAFSLRRRLRALSVGQITRLAVVRAQPERWTGGRERGHANLIERQRFGPVASLRFERGDPWRCASDSSANPIRCPLHTLS